MLVAGIAGVRGPAGEGVLGAEAGGTCMHNGGGRVVLGS